MKEFDYNPFTAKNDIEGITKTAHDDGKNGEGFNDELELETISHHDLTITTEERNNFKLRSKEESIKENQIKNPNKKVLNS
jgi:hypothetical protein